MELLQCKGCVLSQCERYKSVFNYVWETDKSLPVEKKSLKTKLVADPAGGDVTVP